MDCPLCDSDATIIMTSEELQCGDCGGYIHLSHCLCTDCNCAWRVCDGEVLDYVVLDTSDTGGFIDFLKPLLNDDDKDEEKMSDLLFHCVECGSLSYKIDDAHYKCQVCGCEWEVK